MRLGKVRRRWFSAPSGDNRESTGRHGNAGAMRDPVEGIVSIYEPALADVVDADAVASRDRPTQPRDPFAASSPST